MAKLPAAAQGGTKKAPTKTEIVTNIAETTGLNRKDVGAVLEALSEEIRKALSKKGAGMFAIPGLVKITKKQIPARPAKRGVPNPFRPGELMDVAAKPASVKIVVKPLKNLKDMA